jgi:Photosynthesis system II assembly factor YCF48
MNTLRSLISAAALVCFILGNNLEADSGNGWKTVDAGIRALNITTGPNQSIWVCGANEAIAVSSDGGDHWTKRHTSEGGATLLNITFSNDHFGYAFGTGGVIVMTMDAGATWQSMKSDVGTILQASFSDAKHGIVRTSKALLFTADGGTTWQTVSSGQNEKELKRFPYTFSLVALNEEHMAVHIGEGQYGESAFLTSSDGGKSWKFLDIPSVGIASLLAYGGQYWAIGHEVVGKDKPGGGYAVPMALASTDGETWEHSKHEISGCKMEGCDACGPAGCLASNGVVAQVFPQTTAYFEFPMNKEMTSKWAATDTRVCFASKELQCAPLKSIGVPKNFNAPVPPVPPPAPLGAPERAGIVCLACALEPVYLDDKVNGAFRLKMELNLNENGTVKDATVLDAPSPSLKEKIEAAAQQWLFEPTLQDGFAVKVKLNTTVTIQVLKLR